MRENPAGKGLGAHPDLLGRCPEAATARAVKPDRFLPELWWKSYSFCHVDSLLEHPLCPISGCQRKRVNSSMYVWAVGSDTVNHGRVMFSTGNGTWTSRNTTYALLSLAAVDANNLYGVEWDGSVLSSTNGGSSWTLQFQDYWPASVNASATNNVWVVGWDGKTRTYTTSWGAVQTVTDKDLYDAAVVATNSVFAAGNQRFLTYTGTWSSRTGGTGQTVYGIDGYGATGVWMATAYDATYGNVQVTTDGGRSWTTKTTPDNAKNMQSVSVIDQNNIWICGGRYIYYWNGTAFTQQLSANI